MEVSHTFVHRDSCYPEGVYPHHGLMVDPTCTSEAIRNSGIRIKRSILLVNRSLVSNSVNPVNRSHWRIPQTTGNIAIYEPRFTGRRAEGERGDRSQNLDKETLQIRGFPQCRDDGMIEGLRTL